MAAPGVVIGVWCANLAKVKSIANNLPQPKPACSE
jgi:hypothetical protein